MGVCVVVGVVLLRIYFVGFVLLGASGDLYYWGSLGVGVLRGLALWRLCHQV